MFNKVREELGEHSMEFTKREYRPVKDRVNGLFSFVYTLYYQFLHTIILSEGFDPYIGMLHRKRGKHMAFVSDVMEGYRAILTAFVVKLLKEKLIVEDDFDELFFIYNLKLITYYYLNIEEDKLMSFYFFKVLGQSILYQL
jgi:CRISPR-associated protein Cas1